MTPTHDPPPRIYSVNWPLVPPKPKPSKTPWLDKQANAPIPITAPHHCTFNQIILDYLGSTEPHDDQ